MLQAENKKGQQQCKRATNSHQYLNHTSPVLLQLISIAFIFICMVPTNQVNAGVFYPRGASFGYLAAVAIPLDLPNRNVYMAFNFESNYGLPPNGSYNEWIDRWDLDEHYLSLGNNVTAINGRKADGERKKRSLRPPFDRKSFYRTFSGYLNHYGMNGTGCLLRTICEISASTLEENNGVLGSILKILFMPTTSRPEMPLHNDLVDEEIYRAERRGRQHLAANAMIPKRAHNIFGDNNGAKFKDTEEANDVGADNDAGYGYNNNNNGNSGNNANDGFGEDDVSNACLDYSHWCPEGVINMISAWY